MTTPLHIPSIPFPWQGEKRLRSGDRVWILTDTHHFTSALYGCSTPQRWYRVGGLDLASQRLGYFTFSTDDARALLRAGIDAPPWKIFQACGIELTRRYHGATREGRFRERVARIDLDPALAAQGPALRGYFERSLSFGGNAVPGMWRQIVARAQSEKAIEKAALSMVGWFAAGDIKKVVREGVNVTRVLARLVLEQRLVPNGKTKRAARYMVASPIMTERVDWTG